VSYRLGRSARRLSAVSEPIGDLRIADLELNDVDERSMNFGRPWQPVASALLVELMLDESDQLWDLVFLYSFPVG
jgi:hypothetical protein